MVESDADHKHIDPTLAGNRRMMIKIPRTSPCYLIPTNQKKVHELQSSPQMLFLKTLPWNPFGSSGLLHISSSFSLLGILQITLYFPSPQPDVSKLTLLHGRPVDPKFVQEHWNFIVFTKCPFSVLRYQPDTKAVLIYFFKNFLNILFIWLCWVSTAACVI